MNNSFKKITLFSVLFLYSFILNTADTSISDLSNASHELQNTEADTDILKKRSSEMLALILTDPEKARANISQIGEKVIDEVEKRKLDPDYPDLDQIKIVVSMFKQEYPLIFIKECVAGPEDCILNRAAHPHYRRTFEQKTTQTILSKMPLDRALEYVSFGSGGGFQDAVILANVLHQNPRARLNVHSLDLKNTPYVAYCDLTGEPRMVSLDRERNPTLVMSALVALAQREWGSHKVPKESIEKVTAQDIYGIELPHKEVIHWLTQIFPETHITISIHQSCESYLTYIKNNRLEYPDVVCTADIQDDECLLKQGVKNYHTLCGETLLNKPTSSNIWLAKDGDFAGIVTISLESQSPDSFTDEIELLNGSKLPISWSVEEIQA